MQLHLDVYAYCDGRKMSRVFENLFNNIIKYAQPATRVYIEMEYEESDIVITLKNISNYELGFDVSELSERFKRGDSSRHTEVSICAPCFRFKHSFKCILNISRS